MEINENPDFDNIEKYLKDDIRNDFISFIMKDKNLDSKQVEIINEHFTHYNSCIKKLSESIKTSNIRIDLLEAALQYQSKQTEALHEQIQSNKSWIEKIKNSKIFNFFSI